MMNHLTSFSINQTSSKSPTRVLALSKVAWWLIPLESYSSCLHLATDKPIYNNFHLLTLCSSASKSSIRRFVITEKAPTRAFSWLKAATTASTLKTLLRHYAKRALTPRSLNVKLGPQHKSKGRAIWLA